MGTLGNKPAAGFQSIEKQTITGNGGTSYALDHAVTNVNDLEVFVNNVRQEPTTAYTLNGQNIVMSEAIANTDSFYVIYQSRSFTKAVPADTSITTAMLQDNAITAAKIPSNSINASKFVANAISEKTTGNTLTQKFYYANSSPNQQPIYNSFTLSAAEAPLNSWVGIRLEVLSGSSAGDQYCYVYQQGSTGYQTGAYVGNDWYYYSIISSLFPIVDASDRTFNITHGTINHSSTGDYRKVSYLGYWKVTE